MYEQIYNLSDITVAILAGGMGKRLNPLLPDQQKVTARIKNRPFIMFILDQLIAAGAKKVVLCTGYMAEKVQYIIGDKYRSLELIYSKETKPLGTGGALRLALPFFESETVMVMNGDSFVDTELHKYICWFYQKNINAALLLINAQETGRYGRVDIDDCSRVSRFEEKKKKDGPGWVNAGIYLLKKALIQSIPQDKPFSLEREFFPKLAGKELYGFLCKGDFIDIGLPETFLTAEDYFSKNLRHQ